MSSKSKNLVAQLFESRFKGQEAIRKILDNPVGPKRSSLRATRKRRRGNYVKGVHKGNFFRIRLPSSGRKLPNLPKLPPTQPMLKAPTALPPAQTAEATEAILQSHAAGGAASAQTIAQRGPYSDFLRRLGRWFQDNWAVLVLNAGSICTLMGFTRSDILELRTLSMTGSIASAVYLLGQQRILWLSVGWSGMFASVNAFKIFGIYQERNSEVHMNKEQEHVYVEYFLPHGITPKQFERIEAKATKLKLKKGAHLVRKGEKLDHLYLILNGKTRAHILGRHITAMTKADDTASFDNTTTAAGEQSNSSPQVKSGAWIGEMAFMDYYWDKEQRRNNKNAPQNFSGRESFYTIVAVEDCEILRWSHEEMSQLMSTSNDMRSALTRAVTSALVSKVVQMTVSKTKQMPTWSTWLKDWSHNAGANVTVQRVAEGPTSSSPLPPRGVEHEEHDDENTKDNDGNEQDAMVA
ncbi:unnamed protein product [Cylindrotheca closterium]|uniref:Cyclic nucleotide-binding domain-containing protein n=1 Tax=Cylindrotheca closterium TaxID=2856 RepID=A0AAD2CDZ1_9STRA|nr:unnamed protein product [Cylindrotheca closterium]